MCAFAWQTPVLSTIPLNFRCWMHPNKVHPFIYFRLRPQNGHLIKQFLCTAWTQCMTADCQACHITTTCSTLCMCNFMPSGFIVPTIWLSADSTREFSDFLFNHGRVDDAQVAMFTFSTLSATIWNHTWGCCAMVISYIICSTVLKEL